MGQGNRPLPPLSTRPLPEATVAPGKERQTTRRCPIAQVEEMINQMAKDGWILAHYIVQPPCEAILVFQK
jgi:hypothetical protein